MRQVTGGGGERVGEERLGQNQKKRGSGGDGRRDRERNREGETEVTRSKLMHGQTVLSPEDKERLRSFMSANK